MNEKINSLRLDAGISTLENDPRLVVINKNGDVIDPMIGLERFAELIIKECLDQVDEFGRLTKAFLEQGIDPEIDVTKEVLNNFGIE